MKKFILVIMAAVFGYTAHAQTKDADTIYCESSKLDTDYLEVLMITEDTSKREHWIARIITTTCFNGNTAKQTFDTSAIVVLPEELWDHPKEKKIITWLMNHESVTIDGEKSHIHHLSEEEDLIAYVFYNRTFTFADNKIQKVTSVDWLKTIVCNLQTLLLIILLSRRLLQKKNEEKLIKILLIILIVLVTFSFSWMFYHVWEWTNHFLFPESPLF